MTFLGIEFDTVAMELRLPCEKLTELKQRIKLLLGCKNTTLRKIQSIIGLLNFACQVVELCGIILSPKQEIITIVNNSFVLGRKLCIPMQCG
jgi:hypothetical protein